ncbi:MAG: hypothetical protein WC421_02955 [Elusimicrobiales bacterium]
MTGRLLNAYGAPCSREEAVARIRDYAALRGVRAAAREFGVSVCTASNIASGKSKISGKRLISWFARGLAACPVLGVVSPHACREHAAFARTRAAGMVSNPDKLRLYIACRNCKNAKGGLNAN